VAAKRAKSKTRKSAAKKQARINKTTRKRTAVKSRISKVKKARAKGAARARKKTKVSKARSAKKRAPSKKTRQAKRPTRKKLKAKKKPPKARAKKVAKRAKPVPAKGKPKARVAKAKPAKARPALSAEERKKKRATDLAKLIAMRKKSEKAVPAEKAKKAKPQSSAHIAQAAQATTTKVAPMKQIGHIRKRELEKLRTELLAERERLIQELKALDDITHTNSEAGGNHQIPGYSIHLAEYATDNQAIETAFDLRRIQQDRLAQVEEALERVERGDYGICESCGKAISIDRLLAKPSARFCVPCRRAYEAQRS
jgi:RNA polymerase-binding transcription factor DksA